jgi:nucleoside-diphosphate-sugar epimerase
MSSNFFIFGLGYTAQRFAQELLSLGYKVFGTSRQQGKKHLYLMTVIDFEAPDIEYYLSQSTHLLITIPPNASIGDPVLFYYYEMIKRHISRIKWVGYLSSTGVYGDHQGRWVNEESICKPDSSSGLLRLEAEKAWLSYAVKHQLPLHLFRLAGIYGPERNALERIYGGKKYSIFKEGQVFSRVYVDDIVSVLLASIQTPKPLSIYNVADDEPAASHVVDAYAATLLNRSPLPLIHYADASLSLSLREKEFYLSNRRISNLKIKKELDNLSYPSFREGLKHLWSEDFEKKKRN